MLYRTNVGDYRVTVWDKGQGPWTTYCYDVSQRHHDHVAEAIGEDPHRQVGFGLCASPSQALDSAIGHAYDVVQSASLVDQSLRLDLHLGRTTASERTLRHLADYERLTGFTR